MSDEVHEKIEAFLSRKAFAVAGASTNRDKYGNKVVRAYLQTNRRVFPINPKMSEVEGQKAYRDVASLPESTEAISIVTSPPVTLEVVRSALTRGIKYVWMQPGAENEIAIKEAEAASAIVIHGGPCALVAMRYRE